MKAGKLGRTTMLGALLSIWSVSACAARFPDALEKRFVFTGEAAIAAADMFGLGASGPGTVVLRLGRMDAWAIYLLKKDTPEPLVNDNGGSPPRHNSVEFTPSAVPTLSISPYWLDMSVAAPFGEPGRYSFGSPVLSGATDPGDPWARLIQRLRKAPEWNERTPERTAAGPVRFERFKRCADSADGGEICVTVSSIEAFPGDKTLSGYNATISVRPMPMEIPAKRKRAPISGDRL